MFCIFRKGIIFLINRASKSSKCIFFTGLQNSLEDCKEKLALAETKHNEAKVKLDTLKQNKDKLDDLQQANRNDMEMAKDGTENANKKTRMTQDLIKNINRTDIEMKIKAIENNMPDTDVIELGGLGKYFASILSACFNITLEKAYCFCLLFSQIFQLPYHELDIFSIKGVTARETTRVKNRCFTL